MCCSSRTRELPPPPPPPPLAAPLLLPVPAAPSEPPAVPVVDAATVVAAAGDASPAEAGGATLSDDSPALGRGALIGTRRADGCDARGTRSDGELQRDGQTRSRAASPNQHLYCDLDSECTDSRSECDAAVRQGKARADRGRRGWLSGRWMGDGWPMSRPAERPLVHCAALRSTALPSGNSDDQWQQPR